MQSSATQVIPMKKFRSNKSSQMTKVSTYIDQQKIDLSKRFEAGKYQSIADELGLLHKQVKTCVGELRKQRGVGTNAGIKSKDIRNTIKDLGVDVTTRLQSGIKKDIAELSGATIQQVSNVIVALRKNKKHNIYKKRDPNKIPVGNFPNTFVEHCIENKLFRHNPAAEREACEGLCKVIMNNLPRGGGSMIIGTPTAFCASSRDNHKMFLTDNLKVAHILDMTTDDSPTIIIGNGIDPVKAELKAFHWSNNNTTNHFKIETGVVDKVSYTHHVTRLAEKYDVCKVIFMGSGVWTGSTYSEHKWKGFDFDFRSPSEYLVTQYKNLHIVAMTLLGGEHGHFHYTIKHLYHGMKPEEE